MPSRALREYVDLQRGNTYKSVLLGLPGPKLLGLGSIQRNGGFKGDNLKSYGGESDARILLRPGDVYVSLKDVTQSADLLGAVARVPYEVEQGRLTQDTVKLAFKDGAPVSLIYWVLRSPEYRGFCRSFATGTTNLGLPREDFLAYPIPDPTPARLQLVAVLDAIDDKIELNRRMNETLETMARAIFKDWFVDFGPTRVKMEGRAPYLAPDLWSLFPDRLDDEGKPEGWTSYSLGKLATQHTVSVAPSSAPNEVFEHFSLPAYDAGRSPIHDLGETIKSNKTSLPKDAVLLSKLNPEIERVWIPEPASGKRQVCSTEFLVFTPHADGNRPLLFGLFTELSFRTLLQSMVTGTSKSHQRISPPALLGQEILIGSKPTFDQYAVVAEPLLARALANRSESRTLAATRDFLLPKLMSGEVRVKDAEKLVGEAT